MEEKNFDPYDMSNFKSNVDSNIVKLGNVVDKEEISSWQSFKNSLSNAFEMGGDILEFYGIGTGDKSVAEVADEGNLGAYSGMSIASTIIYENIFGREKMKEFAKNSPNFFKNYNPSDSETFQKVLENCF